MSGQQLPSIINRCLSGLVLSTLAFLASVPGSAFAEGQAEGRTLATFKVLADSYTDTAGEVGGDQTRIVFYRPVEASRNNAATIYVNNMYHASLVAGGYSPICLRPGSARVGFREMKVSDGPKDGLDSETPLATRSGRTQYVRVRDSGQSGWSLQQVSQREAEQELIGTRLQVHTISRVLGAEKCHASDKGQIQLVGDDLFRFKFARSDKAGLTGRGTEALDSVIEALESNYSRLDRVTVVGYADPLGDESRNEQLSEERAHTVLRYLEANGLSAGSVQAEGRGSQDLVVDSCSRTASPESIACNQPNRRVVIEVSGQRK